MSLVKAIPWLPPFFYSAANKLDFLSPFFIPVAIKEEDAF
jgi:hypothetical protein